MASGDARVAIRTLQAAAELAENEKLDAICVDTLKRQWDNARQAKQDHILQILTEDHRILYQIVKQQGQILSGDLWQEYLQHCDTTKKKTACSENLLRLCQQTCTSRPHNFRTGESKRKS